MPPRLAWISVEREAIQLAREEHADLLLMDERAGVKAARQLGLPVTGTLGVLASAARRGLLNIDAALSRLRATDFRCTPRLLEQVRRASYRLLQTLEQQRWQPVISPALAFEYEAELKRGLPETGLTLQDVDDFLEHLFSRSKLVQIYFRWRPTLRDPDDDRILELAVRTHAAIVTFNVRDFAEAAPFGIRVISPKEMLDLLGGHE
jgi:predicted nucleic acid-binding protein